MTDNIIAACGDINITHLNFAGGFMFDIAPAAVYYNTQQLFNQSSTNHNNFCIVIVVLTFSTFKAVLYIRMYRTIL